MTFEEVLAQNGKVAYTNVGISMMPLIREGRDVMMIEARETAAIRRYDAVLFRRPGVTGRGAYVLHRILKILPDGKYWIVGDNCTSGEVVDPANVLGVLTQVCRDGRKTIRVTDLSYRAYVLFWCKPYHLRLFLMRGMRFGKRIVRRLLGKRQ